MTDFLRYFTATDEHDGARRTVTVDGDILTVTLYAQDDGDRYERDETRHYRLTEVAQQWVPVEGGA